MLFRSGVTSIGFLENTFIQNHKVLSDYYDHLKKNRLPVERGKILSYDDRLRQWVINSLMCHFKIDQQRFEELFEANFDQYFHLEQEHIERCVNENLIKRTQNIIEVTDLGKIFIRNICMGFDQYLQQEQSSKKFSRTV